MSTNLIHTFSIVQWFNPKKGKSEYKRVVINKVTKSKVYIDLDSNMAMKLKLQMAYELVK